MQHLWNLQLFADGAGTGGTGADAGPQPTGEPAQDAAEPEAPREGAKAPSFDDLLKQPAYKAAYDERVKKAIDGRFRKAKQTEERMGQLQPILEMLSSKYGVTYSPDMDLDALRTAVMDDDSYYEDEADRRGISVESLKQLKKMERENRQLREQEQKRRQDEAWNNVVRQAEAAKQKFPSLDLSTEMQNPAFGRMVAGGVPVEAAYKAVHMDEIMSAGMHYAVQTTQEQTVNHILSGKNRPEEGGAGGRPPASHAEDPGKFTPERRKEIRARVARGERVEF